MPSSARHRAALLLGIGEAVLDPGGWRAVAAVLEAAAPGTRLRRRGQADEATSTAEGAHRLTVPGLGDWVLSPSEDDAPHVLSLPLAEALSLAVRLEESRPLAEAEMEAVLDPLPYAAMLLDEAACLLFANAEGEDLLQSRRLFRPARRGARLRPASRADDSRLEAAAAHILSGRSRSVAWPLCGPEPDRLSPCLRAVGPTRPEPGAARLLLTLRTLTAVPAPDAAV